MLSLLSLYAVAIVASTCMASGLAMLGAQLAARDRAMQTMCIGQGAMIGVLFGIGLNHFFASGTFWQLVLPFISAVVGATATFLLSEYISAKHQVSRNSYFAALFSGLLGAGFLVTAFFPGLENHMAQRYFGDLATLGQSEAWCILVVAIVLIGAHVLWSRSFTRNSFEIAILGLAPAGKIQWIFSVLYLTVVCFAVQMLGFLFSISILFLPTVFLTGSTRPGLSRHMINCGMIGGFATCIGFVLSLQNTRLPTVPAIIITAIVLGFIAKSFSGIFARRA